jgi:hypothetical protein
VAGAGLVSRVLQECDDGWGLSRTNSGQSTVWRQDSTIFSSRIATGEDAAAG